MPKLIIKPKSVYRLTPLLRLALTLGMGLSLQLQSASAAYLGPLTDARQHALDNRYPAHLRWEQIKASKPLPGYIQLGNSNSTARLQLQPGERAVFRINAEELLRLQLHSGEQQGLISYLSEGSGLFHQTELNWDNASQQALLDAQGAARWLLLEADPEQQQPLSLSLYRGRFERRIPQLKYEKLLPLAGDAAALTRLPDHDRQPVWQLLPGQLKELDIEGPLRLKLSSWLDWPDRSLARQLEYSLETQLADQPWHRNQILSWPTAQTGIAIGSVLRPMGREDQLYLDIPPGKQRLRLKSDQPIWLNLTSFAPEHHLFPGLNPLATPFSWDWSHWLGNSELLENRLGEQAWAIAQNNSREDASIQARALLEGAGNHWQQAQRRRIAQQIDWRHGFFRDLPPALLSAGKPPRLSYFNIPQLADEEGAQWPLSQPNYLSQSQWIAQWRNIPSGWLHPLAQNPLSSQYPLPQRQLDTELQLTLALDEDTPEQRLWLQFDQQPPSRLLLLPQSRFWGKLEPSLVELSQRLAATSALDSTSLSTFLSTTSATSAQALTQSGLFGLTSPTAPLRHAAIVKLPLPAGVQRLHWWSETGQPVLEGAVGYRVNREYRLSEQAYLNLLAPLSSSIRQELLQQQLVDPTRTLVDWQIDPLINQWQPLIRWLNARRNSFNDAYSQLDEPLKQTIKLDENQLQNQLRAAQTAAQKQQWLEAFERFRALQERSQSRPKLQLSAWQGQLDALQQLDEPGLWLELLKRTWWQTSAPLLKQAALEQLEQHYLQQDDSFALAGLWSNALATADTNSRRHWIQRLSANLHERAEYALIIDLQLLLEPAERDHLLLIRAAYQQSWTQLFEETLDYLSADMQALWQGYWAQRQGLVQQALDFWQQGGEQGAALISSWYQGLHLQQGAQPDQNSNQQGGLLQNQLASTANAWGLWRAQQPGHRLWLPLPEAAQQAAGLFQLYSPAQQRYLRAYQLGPDTPAKFHLTGPVRLRFSLRLRHDPEQSQLQDWLEINSTEQHWGYPLDSRPSAGLTLIDSSGQLVGQNTFIELALGAGNHELNLATREYAGLLSVEAWLPTEKLSLAEPSSDASSPLAALPYLPQRLEIIGACPLCQSDTFRPTLAALPSTTTIESPSAIEASNPVNEAVLVNPDLAADNSEANLWQQQVRALWKQEIEGVQSSPFSITDVSAMPGLTRLNRRLQQRYRWSLLPSPISSAGIRYRELQGWQPESPALQLRKQLLAGSANNAQWLRGNEQLELRMRNLATTDVELSFRAHSLPARNDLSATLGVSVEGRPELQLPISGNAWQQQQLSIPAGIQRLKLRWIDPHNGLYLELKLRERSAKGAWQELNPSYRRSYHLATPQEPLQLFVQGPQLLRVHRWDDTGEQVSYLEVASGHQRVRIAPDKGESSYRVYQRSADDSAPLPPAERVLNASAQPAIPRPLLIASSVSAPEPPPLFIDRQRIDHDDRGSESLYLSWQRRAEFEAEQDAEQFLELGARYRYRIESHALFGRLDAFVRSHQQGGPSQGIEGRWQWRPEARPWTLTFDSQLLHQALKDLASSADSRAWSARAGVRWERQHALSPNSDHQLGIQLRHRWLSLDRLDSADLSYVDQDVFSPYKADHRQQLILDDRWRYRPWQDTELSAAATLTSNAPYRVWDPDNLRINLDWRQMLDTGSINLGYQGSYRFADRHRPSSSLGQRLGLSWQHWLWNRAEQGWQIRISSDYDLERQAWQGALELSWNRTGGRGFEDFMPSEIDFYRHRRTQPFQALHSNRIEVSDHE